MKNTEKSKTQWHELLGAFLKELLLPVNIHVETEAKVMKESPRIDILLLRRDEPEWTAKQLALLPDGIRDTKATNLLLEFKYTESLNDDAIQQTLGYDFLYKQHNQLKSEQVQSFLLSARKPQKSTLKKLGYKSTQYPGVYHSHFRILKKVVLLSLNELSNEPHNAYIKCFASHSQEKEIAFNVLENQAYNSLTTKLTNFIDGLKGIWFTLPKGEDMNLELTPELLTAWGEKWGESYLSHLKPEQRLAGLKPEERLAGLNPKEILAALKTEQLDVLETYLKQRHQQH